MGNLNYQSFFAESIPLYQVNPVLYGREVCDFHADDKQAEVLMSLVHKDKVSVKAAQGVGKTAMEAISALWFLTCFPYARVVATAPTRQQLNDVLWSEIAKWMERSPILPSILKRTATYVYVTGFEKRWFGVARTSTKPENMQGFHEDNMLFIVDEASGVADPIMEAIDGTLTGANNKLLICGNPTKNSGYLHASQTKHRALYSCHTISAYDVKRTNRKKIEEMITKYGKDSNVVRVRVFGEFPKVEDDVLIPLHLLENSIHSDPRPVIVNVGGEEVRRIVAETIDIGCDVARYGDDKTVIGYKVNEVVKFHKKINGQDLMTTAKQIAVLGLKLIDDYKWEESIPIKVDDGGLGGGVVDKLRELKKNNPDLYWWMDIVPVIFGQPIRHRYYYDTTTYMMHVVKDLLAPENDDGSKKAVELILPDDDDLIAQLSARKYYLNDRGKMIVESKKDMKARKLPSPDEADCVLLLCLPVRTKGGKRSGK